MRSTRTSHLCSPCRRRTRRRGQPGRGRRLVSGARAGLAARDARPGRDGRGQAAGRDGLRLHAAQLRRAGVPARLPRGRGPRRAGEPHAEVRELLDGQVDHRAAVRPRDAAGPDRPGRPGGLAGHRGRPPPRGDHDAQPAHDDLRPGAGTGSATTTSSRCPTACATPSRSRSCARAGPTSSTRRARWRCWPRPSAGRPGKDAGAYAQERGDGPARHRRRTAGTGAATPRATSRASTA